MQPLADPRPCLMCLPADPCCASDAGETPLMALARRGQHKLLSQLLQGPAATSLNRQDAAGYTALCHAAAAGATNACRVLRSYGADPGLRTAAGQTALELAVAGSHTLCTPYLQLPKAAAAPAPEQPQAALAPAAS